MQVATVALAQAKRFADGDDVEPAEDRRAVGLGAQHDRPGVLAGVLDHFAGRVDGVSDGTLEVAVMATEQLGFIAAKDRGGGFGRGLHEPRPGRDRPAASSPWRRRAPWVRRAGLPDHRGGAGLDRASAYAARLSAAIASAAG